jgi:hypothetical protein
LPEIPEPYSSTRQHDFVSEEPGHITVFARDLRYWLTLKISRLSFAQVVASTPDSSRSETAFTYEAHAGHVDRLMVVICPLADCGSEWYYRIGNIPIFLGHISLP